MEKAVARALSGGRRSALCGSIGTTASYYIYRRTCSRANRACAAPGPI